jgi:hypothetical protein
MLVLAQLYGVLQLAALGWAARSVRLRVLLVGVLAGLYGVAVLTLGVQWLWTRPFALVTGIPLRDVVDVAAWTVDPVLEELLKLIPVLVLWQLFPAVRRQWGRTDVLLACAAVGSGVGLAEQLARYGDQAARAVAMDGGWFIPAGLLYGVRVPAPGELLTTWLPAGAAGAPFLAVGGGAADQLNIHLVWSAVAGLGLALVLRPAGARARLAGLALIGFACLDHAANNAQYVGELAATLVTPLTALRNLLGLGVAAALGTAVWLDRRTITAALGRDPTVRPAAPLWPLAVARPPWSALVVAGFVRLRRAYCFAGAAGTDGADGELRAAVVELGSGLELAAAPGGRRIWDTVAADARSRWSPAGLRERVAALRAGQRLQLALVVLWLALLAVPAVYFVLGGQPALGGLQSAFTSPVLFWVVVAAALAALAWTIWNLAVGVRRLPAVRALALADPAAAGGLTLVQQTGALVLMGTALLGVLGGEGATGRLLRNFHLLDAFGDVLLVLALVLAIAAIAAFPPFALAGVVGGGTTLVFTGVSTALATHLIVAAGVGTVGIVLNHAAADGGGGGGGGGSGGGGQAARGPRYEPSPKHGPTQRGNVARAPTNGQRALDRSVQVSENSPRRVGVDKENGEYVVLDETHPGQGVYHGHVRTWDQLRPEMQNALRRAGLVDRRGRIL